MSFEQGRDLRGQDARRGAPSRMVDFCLTINPITSPPRSRCHRRDMNHSTRRLAMDAHRRAIGTKRAMVEGTIYEKAFGYRVKAEQSSAE